MRYQVTYWDTLEHVVQLYDSDNLDDCITEYKRLLSTWESSDVDDFIMLEEYDDDEYHYETLFEHTFND